MNFMCDILILNSFEKLICFGPVNEFLIFFFLIMEHLAPWLILFIEEKEIIAVIQEKIGNDKGSTLSEDDLKFIKDKLKQLDDLNKDDIDVKVIETPEAKIIEIRTLKFNAILYIVVLVVGCLVLYIDYTTMDYIAIDEEGTPLIDIYDNFVFC